MPNNHYNKTLKSFSRQHRNLSMKAEIHMWSELLRNRKMMGYSFLRQRPIGLYIADFFCKDLKLVIETDGCTHEDANTRLKDESKQKELKKMGYSVLRFNDLEVVYETDEVKRKIEDWIKKSSPCPLQRSTNYE